MTFSRRKKYYTKCQEIIDDLHRRVDKGEYVSENHCKFEYGTSEYNALIHELHMMNADDNLSVMTPAMEWLYHSQYFRHKAYEERRERKMFILTIVSVAMAIVSAFYAGRSGSPEIQTQTKQEEVNAYNKQEQYKNKPDQFVFSEVNNVGKSVHQQSPYKQDSKKGKYNCKK